MLYVTLNNMRGLCLTTEFFGNKFKKKKKIESAQRLPFIGGRKCIVQKGSILGVIFE